MGSNGSAGLARILYSTAFVKMLRQDMLFPVDRHNLIFDGNLRHGHAVEGQCAGLIHTQNRGRTPAFQPPGHARVSTLRW